MNELEKARQKLNKSPAKWPQMAIDIGLSLMTLRNVAKGLDARYRTVRKILDYSPEKKP